MAEFKFVIKYDVNDGDIRTSTHTVGLPELDKLCRLFKLLTKSSFGSTYQWDVEEDDLEPMIKKYADVMTEEEVRDLSDYIGTCENGYCRSVEEVYYTPVSEIFKVL